MNTFLNSRLIIILLAGAWLTHSSCFKPNEEKPPLRFSFKFRMNGVYNELKDGSLTYLTNGYSTPAGTGYSMDISGAFYNSSEHFRIKINNPLPVDCGINYTQYPVYDDGNYIQYDSGFYNTYHSAKNPLGLPQQFKCSFTDIRPRYVQGYLEATLYSQPSPGVLKKIVLTEGEFKIY